MGPEASSFESGGAIESAWLQPLFGAGSTAAASLLAGNVFLATANPATLMTIGAGVGSAVMGPAGIVAQAPFVAASSALLPVVAPVMLFVTVPSMITGARLDRLQTTLGALAEILERVLDVPGRSEIRGAAPGGAGRKVEQCSNTFRALLDEDPIEGFHKALQDELSEVRPYHLPSQFSRWFGGRLPARIRNVETIRETFRPIRERIERWTSALESAGGATLEECLVVYRDRNGDRALRAQHTRDLRLQRTGA